MASDLHSIAVNAEQSLEQLATGLAQAGADDNTVQAVTKMAEVTRQVVKALGAGQEQTADSHPPVEQQPQHHTMDSATADLHNQMMSRAQAQG